MILIDTHVLLWWLSNPERLSKKAIRTIETTVSDNTIYVSSISAWEIAMLVEKKRLVLTMEVKDWIIRSEALPFIKYVPVNNSIAIKSVQLQGNIHNDPVDRIIIATALLMNAQLVTKDERLRKYKYIKTIW